jgi:hypothetical protein
MSALSKFTKAAVIALALGGSAMTAMPAQAQPSPNVDFNFRFGGPGFGFSFGTPRPGRPNQYCMSDRQVRADLRRDGYREIRFFDRRGRIVQVRAELGRRDYRIAYDTCTGRIVDRDRIRRR